MNKTDFYKVLEAVEMKKKRIAIALGHDALGTTLPEQKEATRRAAKAIAVNDRCMTNRDMIPDHNRKTCVCMKNAAILNVAAFPDSDTVMVSSGYCLIPETTVFPHTDSTDYRCIWRNVCTTSIACFFFFHHFIPLLLYKILFFSTLQVERT